MHVDCLILVLVVGLVFEMNGRFKDEDENEDEHDEIPSLPTRNLRHGCCGVTRR